MNNDYLNDSDYDYGNLRHLVNKQEQSLLDVLY